MGHIFFSYSHKDKDYVHKLQEALIREGFNVWIDDRIDYGTRWPKVIQEHLDNCDAFIVIVSDNSFESEWVQNEVTRAKRIGKPFFPLLLSGNPWLSIESTQYVDVTNGAMPPEKFYARLALVTPRGEHAVSSDSLEPVSEVTSRLEPPRSKFKLDPKTISVIAIVTVIILASLFGLNRALRSPPVPAPTSTTSPSPSPLPTLTQPPMPELTSTVVSAIPSAEITDQNAQMTLIPAGDFIMGSDTGNADEKPAHKVFLDVFYIDKYKVTNALYKMCVDAHVCSAPQFSNSYLRPTYYGDSRYDDFPVVGVNWYMSKAYCEWRGARLPSEAEWEKAARGPDGRTYPWGEGIDQIRANYNNNNDPNYVGDTSKVDAYPNGVSAYGIFDMAGNVWEWTMDLYDANYYASLTLPVANPLGPTSGQYRVIRGGSWNSNAYALRSARRSWNTPANANVYIGFRCARNP